MGWHRNKIIDEIRCPPQVRPPARGDEVSPREILAKTFALLGSSTTYAGISSQRRRYSAENPLHLPMLECCPVRPELFKISIIIADLIMLRDLYGKECFQPVTDPNLVLACLGAKGTTSTVLEFDQPVVWSDDFLSWSGKHSRKPC